MAFGSMLYQSPFNQRKSEQNLLVTTYENKNSRA